MCFVNGFGAIRIGLAIMGLTGCMFAEDKGIAAEAGAGVNVEVSLRTGALAKSVTASSVTTDSVHVRVTAPDMESAGFGFTGNNPLLTLSDLTPGENRRFEVRLFSRRKLLYYGEATTSLYTDRKNAVSLFCLPEFSGLSASLHVPLDFPKAVKGGRLVVWNATDTFSVAPTENGELRNFRLEQVPGDRQYSVSLVLWDASGDTVAKAELSAVQIPKGQNVALVLPLVTTFPQLQLSMVLGDAQTTSIQLTLTAGKRTPAAFGEVVFSELYPVPSVEDSSDNGEWLELFNRMSDTLDVSGCQIVRDAGTSSGMLTLLPAGTVIPPGRGLVVGRAAVAFADVRMVLSPLTLTNTSARLEFTCGLASSGAMKLDTLTYTTSASDLQSVRIATGKVASLKPSRIATRRSSEAWCASAMRPASGETGATPGTLFGSCGE